MADPLTWQDAVQAGRALARQAWTDEGLPGPHAVLTAGAISAGDDWVLVHGTRAYIVDGDEDAGIMDPPTVAVDRYTGEPRIVVPQELDLADAAQVGVFPEHLRWG